MRAYMKDLGKRMKEIKSALDTAPSPSPTPTKTAEQLREEEAMLDELVEIVESIDYARDLHKVGGLDTLLALMACAYPSLRWRAAEVAAACMANNPPVQRWFMEGGAAAALMGLLGDADAICRTKALLALSALVRHYDPGLEAFRLAGGLHHLLAMVGARVPAAGAGGGGGGRSGCGSGAATQQQAAAPARGEGEEDAEDAAASAAAAERRLRRKALSLLQYVFAKHPTDAAAAAQLGAPAALAALLADPAADSDLRTAALQALLEIVQQPAGWAAVKPSEPRLPTQLEEIIKRHEALPAEDRGAEAEEGEAARKLLALLRAAAPPPPVEGRATFDHIEVDEWQDGQAGSSKTVELKKTAAAGNGGGTGAQQEKQQPVLGLPAP